MLLNNTTKLATTMSTKNKWDHTVPKKEPVRERSWSQGHHYRTSSRDMSHRNQQEQKNYAVPKYAGFIPGLNANSEKGKGFTPLTRDCFDMEKNFQTTHTRFRSTGFYEDQGTFDKTRPAFSRRYGVETRMPPHEACHENWSTTFRKSYVKPTTQNNPIAKTQGKFGTLVFDDAQTIGNRKGELSFSYGVKQPTKNMGYNNNYQLWDTQSWATEKNFHTDQQRSEYRNRFNQAKPFHRMTAKESAGRRKPDLSVYDIPDG